MLPKKDRLNLKTSFKDTASGKKFETENFKIFYKERLEDGGKVGISLSKKYFNKAHDRNRARRLTAEALLKVHPISTTVNIVIMPKSNVLNTEVKNLIIELEDVKSTVNFN